MKNIPEYLKIGKLMLESLPKEERLLKVNELKDLGFLPDKEYSIQEIAYLTGYNRSTINTIFNNAIKKLRNEISKRNLEL